MTVLQAREAARQWVLENAGGIAGFRGAYTAGSTNWLPDDALLPATSDLDLMVLADNPAQAGRRGKLLYRDTLLEVSCLDHRRLQSADLILGDYHLAPGFHTAHILLDPEGNLEALRPAVRRDYAKRPWVVRRCAQARARVLEHLQPLQDDAPFADQMIAWLFAAGITTHILLAAGLGNPTVRTRYTAVRALLREYGHLEFHETLLELLGTARLRPEQVARHVAPLAEIFDAARRAIRTPFPFASDISGIARPIAIEGSLEMIGRGDHREAMFWIAVTHSRCRQVLARDAPQELTPRFHEDYRELARDLGVPSLGEISARRTAIARMLPRVCALAEAIIHANRAIEQD